MPHDPVTLVRFDRETVTAREVLEALAALKKAENAEIVGQFAPDVIAVWPGIEKTEGVSGGSALVARSRTPVWVLERFRRLGSTDEQLLADYPTLRAVDLVDAWAYADAHRSEIDEEIARNEAA
jgi:uncharacterized protein (DUF433 family)